VLRCKNDKKKDNNYHKIINNNSQYGGEIDNNEEEDSSDDEEDEDEYYLQKFTKNIHENYILDNHPESIMHNYDEIIKMSKVVRDTDNRIIDLQHQTTPILTRYEKSRIVGVRAKQLNSGSLSLIKNADSIIDGMLIAELELKEKKVPFIIRRPLPNGSCEYWNIKDLEIL
jgi:DNA-directed RNA polymerase I, II, and III subunit RPABC2